jgi:hypothetical protein
MAAAPVDPHALHLRVGGELLGCAGLSDPGLADQQEELSLPPAGLVDRVSELPQLGFATHEDAAGQPVERVLVLVAPWLRRRWGCGRSGLELASRRDRVRGALLGSLREQPEHHLVERRGNLGAKLRGRHRGGAQVLADDRDRILAREGRLAGEHLVEKGAEGVEIRARTRAAAERLLGGQVRDGAHEGAVAAGTRLAALGEREAEVAETGAAVLPEPHVRGLQVAVDDSAAVRVLERAAHVGCDRERAADLETAILCLLQQRGDVPARHVRRDDVRPPLVLAALEHPDDVGMLPEP